MIEVVLDKSEILNAAIVGVRRQASSINKKSKDRFKKDEDNGWQIHIIGSLGECAAAKALGMYWGMGVDTYKSPDIEPNIQVRTRSKHDQDLIVRADDSDDELFVLVTGIGPKFNVVGYLKGKDAKKKQYEKNPHGWGTAYFVPQLELEPIEDLLK